MVRLWRAPHIGSSLNGLLTKGLTAEKDRRRRKKRKRCLDRLENLDERRLGIGRSCRH